MSPLQLFRIQRKAIFPLNGYSREMKDRHLLLHVDTIRPTNDFRTFIQEPQVKWASAPSFSYIFVNGSKNESER